MSKYLNQMLAMAKTHLFVSLVATLMGTFMMPFEAGSFSRKIFSCVFTLIYAICIYTKAAEAAKRDKRNYPEEAPNMAKGLLLPAIIYIIWICFFVLYKVSWQYSIISYSSGLINNLIFIIWNYVFSGFLNPINGNLEILGIIIFFAVSLISSCLGYIAGVKNFDISIKVARLIYEEKDSGKKEG